MRGIKLLRCNAKFYLHFLQQALNLPSRNALYRIETRKEMQGVNFIDVELF